MDQVSIHINQSVGHINNIVLGDNENKNDISNSSLVETLYCLPETTVNVTKMGPSQGFSGVVSDTSKSTFL